MDTVTVVVPPGANEPLLDDDAFEVLYEKSQGVPREIIRLCAMATDYLLQSDSTMVSRDIANEVFIE